MNKSINFLIKGLILLKSASFILFLISTVVVALDLYETKNQVEGRELIESTPTELISLIVFLFMLSMTLLFDIKTLKLKNEATYKQWTLLFIFTILVITIIFIFKIQWLGISLMLLLGFYGLYLFSKYPKK